ncbi:PKD domain-containing protein [uncultured Methanospirillum sp.]|uniref:PKD domain-containing protein n=1 Tax=uncultured Methanospirillum sp. TaxID=262503 RepID=UPI0029C93AE6|nr:PKD domain-containing protein [uncultured Methanospirillum sp.]
MIRSSGINTHRSLLWIFIAGMICGSSFIWSATADLVNTDNETVTAEYENGTVTAEWAVDFTASPLEGYPPVCAKFNLDGPFGDYLWDFGDGSTSSARNPVHCYQKAGSYWVKLKYSVGEITGEVNKEDYIKVKNPAELVDYTADPVNGTVPLTVQFELTGNPTSILWDFDDGEESSDANPKHLYQHPGYYSPTLTYCAGGACDKISKYNYIQVSPGEEVNFTAEKLEGVAPLSTKFLVTGPAETFSWDFGDGTTSYEKNPGHYYDKPGNYTVTLTYSIAEASYTLTRTDYIHATSKYAPDINGSPRRGIAPLCVDLDMINPPQSWLWMFGDNTTSPDAHGSHCYGFSGSYDVGLHYCYNGYCSDVIKPGFVTVDSPRIFSDRGDDEATVKFRSDAGEGLRYIWDFGDSATSESAAPTHRYSEPGEYNVSLSVLGTCGCTAKTSARVSVNPKNPIDFTATPLEGCAPHSVQFSTAPPASLAEKQKWDFGDGETSTENNPFHSYQFPGIYSVTLVKEFPDRQENVTKSDYIQVYEVPHPSFSMNPSSGVAPATITFTDTTTGYESKRSWDFGDDVTGTEARMEHQYTQEGVFNVSLTVWGKGDCHKSVTHDVRIASQKEVKYDLTGLPRRGTAPLSTSFKITGSPYQWSIDFGDGSKPTSEQNPFHTYTTPGAYSPKLQACDAGGCEDIAKQDYIVAIPPSYQTLTLSPGWNLVSTPFSLEPGEDTMEIFASVDTASHSLYSWDSTTDQWKRVTKDTHLDPLTAVWIYAAKPAGVTLPMATAGPEGNLTRPLSAGWNLMSIPGTNLTSPDTILRDQDWSYILGFNAQSQQYDAPVQKENESGQLIDPKQGYWLYMGNPGTLVTPAI